MCKLLLMTGIQESLVAREFMKLLAVSMSKGNAHGIGYTAVKPDGNMFSERWLNNASFMSYNTIMTPEIAKALEPFADRLPSGSLLKNYDTTGDIDFSDIRTVTMHTRWATCGREFKNTHPFIDQDVSLVHNGVIRNAEYLNVNKISTCDSEAALQTYINKGVRNDTTKAKEWLNLLSGSWAFGILSRNNVGNRILDVVKGSSSLYSMQVEGLGLIFATDKDDVLEACKTLGLQVIVAPSTLEQNTMFRFDATTGEQLETIDVKPLAVVYSNSYGRGADYYQYGRTIGNTSTTSSQSSSGNVIPMSQKDKEYNAQLLGEEINRLMELEDFLDAKGRIDHRVVMSYTRNSSEPLIDRLDIFDKVYNRTLVSDFESLPVFLQDAVEDCDMMQGFKEARFLILELIAERSKFKG